MYSRFTQVVAVTVLFVIAVSLTPLCRGQDFYTENFQLTHYSGGATYQLHVYIPETLYSYYNQFNINERGITGTGDFEKFVTPYAVEPIAD
jgi:hypothetical protein